MPKVERVIVPVSGGGLISGIALALKTSNPFIEIIGVCATSGNSFLLFIILIILFDYNCKFLILLISQLHLCTIFFTILI